MALPKQDQATRFPWDTSAGCWSTEQLYQMFKRRLIEELRCKPGHEVTDGQAVWTERGTLIDTTEGST